MDDLDNFNKNYKEKKYVKLLDNYLFAIKNNIKLNDYKVVNRIEKKKAFLLNDYSKIALEEFNIPNSIFEISMLNLEKVKNHLLDILNFKFLLIINYENYVRANSQIENGNIIVINEKKIISTQTKNFKKLFFFYLTPLIMTILHEINHLKILRKIENSDTPVHHKKIHFPTESLTIFEETMKTGESWENL